MTVICQIRTVSEWLQGPCGIGSAAFWFIAAWKSGKMASADFRLAEVDMNARTQSWLNAVAASLTGAAAALQVILFYLPSCRDFG